MQLMSFHSPEKKLGDGMYPSVVWSRQRNHNGARRFLPKTPRRVFSRRTVIKPQPSPGDLVEITGISHPGGYAPFISYAHWAKLGTARLPVAKPVAIEQLMAGTEDGQRVEISGMIRSVVGEKPVWAFEVISGGHRLKVNVPPLKDTDPQKLVGASVRLQGTASAVFSGQLRQLIRVVLHVPFQSDFIVEKTDPSEPFGEPVLPLNSLGQFGSGRELGKRVHVRGAVTYQRPGEDVFLRDATGGLQVKSSQLVTFTPGEVVEAVGFWDFEQSLPVLQDAVFRKTDEPIQKVEPKPATIGELQAGYRHADLIRLQGRCWIASNGVPARRMAAWTDNQPFLPCKAEGLCSRWKRSRPGPTRRWRRFL